MPGYLQAISYPECLRRPCANGVATWGMSALSQELRATVHIARMPEHLQATSYPECLGRRCAIGVVTWGVSA